MRTEKGEEGRMRKVEEKGEENEKRARGRGKSGEVR